jgi:hypothetical protein
VRRAVLGGTAVVGVFFAANLILYGRLLQPYFGGGQLDVSDTTLEALAGNLVSPARGLFVFVPIAALSIYGFHLKRKHAELTGLDLAVVATIVGSWLVASLLPHWWGGWSYGPRFLADIAPFTIWFLLPVFTAISPDGSGAGRHSPRPLLAASVVVLVACSVFIHARGAIAESTAQWNDVPEDIDDSPERLWDWSDPPLLR